MDTESHEDAGRRRGLVALWVREIAALLMSVAGSLMVLAYLWRSADLCGAAFMTVVVGVLLWNAAFARSALLTAYDRDTRTIRLRTVWSEVILTSDDVSRRMNWVILPGGTAQFFLKPAVRPGLFASWYSVFLPDDVARTFFEAVPVEASGSSGDEVGDDELPCEEFFCENDDSG